LLTYIVVDKREHVAKLSEPKNAVTPWYSHQMLRILQLEGMFVGKTESFYSSSASDFGIRFVVWIVITQG